MINEEEILRDYKKEIAAYLDAIKVRKQDSVDTIVEKLMPSKYVCVFGAGGVSRLLVSMLRKFPNSKIDFICDNDNSKWGQILHEDLPCISPDELEKYRDDIGIIIATRYCSEVYEQLRSRGFNTIFFLKEYRLLNSPYFEYGDTIESIKRNALKLLDILGDEKSKEVLLTIIKTWFDFDVTANGYARLYSNDQYYPEKIIRLGKNEAFVDGGAYTGDSLLDFVDKSNRSFHSIFAFELDEGNFKTLKANVDRLDPRLRKKIKLYNLGLLDKERFINYETGNSKGKNTCISETGLKLNMAKTARLSNILGDKKVTYLKLDVEGAELEALYGSQEIIIKQKPKLAICVYHKLDHLWEIPFYIKSIVPEYEIFLRHHSMLEYETVCYALHLI